MASDSEELPFHTITNRDVWAELILIKGKQDETHDLLIRQMDKQDRHDGRLMAIEKRVSALDFKFYAIVSGLILILGGLVASAAGAVPL
jgi:hypothetical protein